MDVIADMFARIRNGIQRKRDFVDVPHSKLKQRILELLKQEGYIQNYEILEDDVHKKGNQPTIRIYLKYLDQRKTRPAIEKIEKVSTPGRRVYTPIKKMPHVRRGLGLAIVSCDSGIISDAQARKLKKGGEIIGYVY
ncbi:MULTISPECIES: 30S ribosomal protein S8 [unclassified Hydrogenobaculum]|uniref:30S ribosomal protein S8 n=1 Tax=unclassified Hydrogenobaculum TaxID=2622382 RepID=UPI0001C52225|nr:MULTISPECIES: 30S ribosomal protein S8 [unclassified Hydrogenobaculum]AEF18683.1 ribosomal protein S8 [Hydrogenobaculum sp. 3684]AEG45971.1 ribosomal protein S8 [Hydrogenobaculum sp. SHO]AGG14614.1 ribosomal protein S8 [Hydrogenobaculum sp. HO]AGH92913.1 ribosomal protein S8 [Hydrogenobaculum sp. SN]